MQLILFFTNPDSLSAIGVLFPWADDTEVHQFRVAPDHNCIERQIWVIRDEISFAALRQQLDAIPFIDELYYVYHSLPLTGEFLHPFKAYLLQRGIFSKSRKSHQVPNVPTVYEELKGHELAFTAVDFKRIVERIQPGKDYMPLVLNKLSDVGKVLDHQVNLFEYPGWVRSIYAAVMTAVDPGNFEEKKMSLKMELEKYCQGLR
jgi:hypothetical protein